MVDRENPFDRQRFHIGGGDLSRAGCAGFPDIAVVSGPVSGFGVGDLVEAQAAFDSMAKGLTPGSIPVSDVRYAKRLAQSFPAQRAAGISDPGSLLTPAICSSVSR